MRARVFVCVMIGAATLLPAAGAAQQARIMDLEECTAMAMAHDPGLRFDELESAAANARLREMEGQKVPSVSVQAGYSRLSDVTPGSLTIPGPGGPVNVTFPAAPLNSALVKLLVQEQLFTGFRIASSIRQAEAARVSAASDVQRTRSDVRYAVQTAFWQLAKARSLEAAAKEGQAQQERKLAETRTFFDQGVATRNDVTQAGTRLEEARIESLRAANARELARVQLAQLIGVPLGEAFDIPDATPSLAPDPAPAFAKGLEDLVSQALAARPELAGARSRVAAQEAALDVAHSGRFPTVFLTGDYTLANPNPRVFPQQDEFTATWSVGIMASFDIGRYPMVSAQEDQARSRAAQAREAMRRQSDAVAAEVVRAAISLNAALAVYSSLKSESLQAEEYQRYVDERFREGVVLQSAQLDAQSLLVRARLREQAGLIDCFIARAGLTRAVGE
jgi:outer membrane protein TolC